ncbi:U-box domain-containing protein [Fadolivirus algeromassiliense]|jgi:hypothetical protein|uniref:U-box domain-containing protein n=1 Tax=Fadolivirus FV1/VV64 TaxID=3070911 RepID=A0A7D3QWD3_9VIRU|nr:U-box domain-containing protein [Fadolivirus algeromassiliense]QKF94399.1 U-box domain-containing protein [Fadolivirus FV1/VV64]
MSEEKNNKRTFSEFAEENEEMKLLEQFSTKRICIDTNDITCPISKLIYNQPVLANDGFTYEKYSIDQILNGDRSKLSPMTRESLSGYTENKFMMGLVNNFLTEHPEFKKLQFDDRYYCDYMENKRVCQKLLTTRNWKKFSQYNNICLQDKTNTGENLIKYLSIECNDVVSFNKILDNSIDLNICNDDNVLPIHIVSSFTKLKDVVIHMITKDVDLYNMTTKVSVIVTLCENKRMSYEDKSEILLYLIKNNKINLSFVNSHKHTELHTILTSFMDDIGNIWELLSDDKNILEHSWQLLDVKLICDSALYLTFDNMLDYLHVIGLVINKFDKSQLENKLIEHYKNNLLSKLNNTDSIESFAYLLLHDINDNDHIIPLNKKHIYDKIMNIFVNQINMEEIFNKAREAVSMSYINDTKQKKDKLYQSLIEKIEEDDKKDSSDENNEASMSIPGLDIDD